MEGQPISVEALERPVEENRPPPNPVEGAGTGPMFLTFCFVNNVNDAFIKGTALLCLG